jgi:hypothetical protein
MALPRITERTFYPFLIDILDGVNGDGIQEVSFGSEPDIIFELNGQSWLLGVKIGESATILRQAFLQYLRHKEDSGLNHGILLFLSEDARNVTPNAQSIRRYLDNSSIYCLLDTPNFREEVRRITFKQFLNEVIIKKLITIEKHDKNPFSLELAVKLLKEHVIELMQAIHLREEELINLVTHPSLFSDLANFTKKEDMEYVGRFLAAYILLSQIIFLRILYNSREDIRIPNLTPISASSLRRAFEKILEINYRPIFSIDVLGSLNETYIKDTFDIIWGLRIEEVQYELPGRIYNELMPEDLRKMMAAFFTRPIAAELLANLSIERSNVTLLDPSCGSGTLLVAGYNRKKHCFIREKRIGNPHQLFCEHDIHGMDIMPFSAHLSAANLAACEPRVPIEHTKITAVDSLKISRGEALEPGIGALQNLYPEGTQNLNDPYEIKEFDVVLMNPPFTKIERGIRQHIELERYRELCGGEVGLWGHFIPLAYDLLKDNGILGAVIPINILRGRESSRVREFLFSMFTPLFIIKPVVNYAFSESAEYRDIIIIGKKGPPSLGQKTKFVLFRENISSVTKEDILVMVDQIKHIEKVMDPSLPIHINTVPTFEVKEKLDNLMYFCGFSSLGHREILLNFLYKYTSGLSFFPTQYFREGFNARPRGASKVLFLTRDYGMGRTQEAFLRFNHDKFSYIDCYTELETRYSIPMRNTTPSLRTIVGVDTMSLVGKCDYVTNTPHENLSRIVTASGFASRDDMDDPEYWSRLQSDLNRASTHLVIVRKINPFSPNTNLVSFFSQEKISPSNVVHPVLESNPDKAKAMCTVFNSILFWVQFFFFKGESTGRYIDIRHTDLKSMKLFIKNKNIKSLCSIYEKYANRAFPAFKNQLDVNFDEHYLEYRSRGLLSFEKEFSGKMKPSSLRLDFDKEVLNGLGFNVQDEELIEIYSILAKEMMVIKNLSRE